MTSALTQCIGPEFGEQPDGTLVVRLAGNPSGAALPSTGNGARVDPDRGLWVPAPHTHSWVRNERTDTPGDVVIHPGGTRKSGVMKTTMTNTHATRSMVIMATLDVTAVFNIAPNSASYTGWALESGIDVDADPTKAVPLNRRLGRRDIGADTEAGNVESVSQSLLVFLDPGQSSDVRAQLELTCYEDGYVRYIRSYMTMTGLAVTR